MNIDIREEVLSILYNKLYKLYDYYSDDEEIFLRHRNNIFNDDVDLANKIAQSQSKVIMD